MSLLAYAARVLKTTHLWIIAPACEMLCILCGRPLDLQVDLSANESGNAVHDQGCHPAAQQFFPQSCSDNGRLISTATGGGGTET
jgi:hypothetical protein